VQQHQNPWFALRIRHQCENSCSVFLRYAGFGVCSPTYVLKRRWSDRIKLLEVPLFPGYIFCQMNPAQQRGQVLSAPGVVQIVGIGNTPVPVDPSEMAAVQRSVDFGLIAEPADVPRPADRVLIQSGPFRGLEGVVVQRKKRQRIILTVTLLQRAMAVEVDEGAVWSVNERSRAARAGC
jgi:transcription antitermination factor NusG